MRDRTKFSILIFILIFVFIVFFKGLYKKHTYYPVSELKKIEFNKKIRTLDNQNEYSIFEITDNNFFLVNIWSSWCAPCRDEHKYLVTLKKDGVDIIGINYKDKVSNAKNFLEKLGNPYKEILIDLDGTNSIELGAIGVPETFLINSDSKEIIKKYIGPIDYNKTVEILEIINEKKI